jgi:predicted transcriptional regulator of viral defense system
MLGNLRVSLARAVRRGQLERVGRGLYGLPERRISVHGALAEESNFIEHDEVADEPVSEW